MVTPIVLAAGASARMKKPKSLLDFEGRTCLEIVVAALDRPRCGAAVVVLGYQAPAVRERVVLPGVATVVNEAWERGQTASVRAGLHSVPADSDGALVVPVDLALLLPEDVDRLLDAFDAERDRFDIFVTSHAGRRGHPVLFARRVFPEIHALADDQPLHLVVRRDGTRVRHVVSRNPGVLDSMNTPEEYAAVLTEYRQRSFGGIGMPSDWADTVLPPAARGGAAGGPD